ncbi:transposase, partial [Bifidobacterium pseudocatenulatum]|uniref:transposase n=1 Tax=Bifidobacterium pseudocatenulatum TaxID=28026 RepID=UPI0034A29AB1
TPSKLNAQGVQEQVPTVNTFIRSHTAVFYFALPHHPWQRGTNENTNGLVREYFPKGTDFDAAGDERVREVYDAISHRPRKRHGFRTPYEVHHSQTLHLL